MEKNKEVVSKGFINKGNKGLEEGREQVTWIPSRHILDTAPPMSIQAEEEAQRLHSGSMPHWIE